ncbi:MAG: hypothetical protein ACLQJR_04120 [Stellaceae bacterium]
MKIIPERVTVIPDAQRNELTVIMEGFRLTLSAEEARALSYALVQGAKQLAAEPTARSFAAGASAAVQHKSAPPSFTQEVATSKADEVGAEAIRSLSA